MKKNHPVIARPVTVNGKEDMEAKAEAALTEQRNARAQKCLTAIMEVLDLHRCEIRFEVQIGAQQFVPLASVLALPTRLAVIPKASI